MEVTSTTTSLNTTQKQATLSTWTLLRALPTVPTTITGLEIATNTVAFATKFLPFATKISGEVANL